MEDSHQGNVMTEIALALAMGFFSLMVLTMISMGAGKSDNPAVAAAMLAPAKPASAEAATTAPSAEDMIVVYHDGRFFDRNLKPIDPSSIATTGRVLLALDPALPLAEAMTARTRINVENLVVSTLDDRWLTTLRREIHARD